MRTPSEQNRLIGRRTNKALHQALYMAYDGIRPVADLEDK